MAKDDGIADLTLGIILGTGLGLASPRSILRLVSSVCVSLAAVATVADGVF